MPSLLAISRKAIPWVLLACSSAQTVSASMTAKVLLYTATKGFRHDSIPTAVDVLQQLQSSLNIIFDHTEDETQFTDSNLATYDAIMFVSTTGEVLDQSGKDAFQNYLNLGGNFVGVHAASDCLVNTTFYGQELGAYFDYHPALQNATVDVLVDHPSTSMLPKEWHIQEEMYNFKSDPRSLGAVVLLAANESSYVDTGVRKFNQGTPHPSAWYQEHGAGVESGHTAGRSFYTSLGHLNETWEDSLFQAHVIGGLMWALQANTTRAFNASAQVGNAASTSSASGSSTGTVSGAASSSESSNGAPSSAPSGGSSASLHTAPATALMVATGSIFLLLSLLAY